MGFDGKQFQSFIPQIEGFDGDVHSHAQYMLDLPTRLGGWGGG